MPDIDARLRAALAAWVQQRVETRQLDVEPKVDRMVHRLNQLVCSDTAGELVVDLDWAGAWDLIEELGGDPESVLSALARLMRRIEDD